jgi:hypothetical protein
MGKKQKVEIPQVVVDRVEYTLMNAKEKECFLFIGRAYGTALSMVYDRLCYVKAINFYTIGSISDYEYFLGFCAEFPISTIAGHVLVLHLKRKDMEFQEGLKVVIERLQIPILVFVDNDGLSDSLVSRFGEIYKMPNEIIKSVVFTSPDKVFAKRGLYSPYECPSIIKLVGYEKLSPSEVKMDTAISLLSGNGSVYPEVLSELHPPVNGISYETKIEVLSLLKKRRISQEVRDD